MGIHSKRLQNREERELQSRAEEMPHRKLAGDCRLDARLESPLGRLFFSGKITQPQYEAGIRFYVIMARWCESIDAPRPYGGELSEIEDDVCFRRKILFSQAKSLLDQVAPCCYRVVSRVAFFEKEPRGSADLELLRRGLAALSGEPILPFFNKRRNLAAA